MDKRKLIVGNWKMNGSLAANESLVRELLAGIGQPRCEVAVCPPGIYLAQLQALLAGSPIELGVQNVSMHEAGAFTGDVSADMLRDFGVRYAIVGHSERRQYQGETDLQVARKAGRALAAGITPIVCVGETLAEREQGLTGFIVQRQLSAVIALNGRAWPTSWWPTSPSGPSARARPPPPSRRSRCMPPCARSSRPPARRRRACAFCTAAA